MVEYHIEGFNNKNVYSHCDVKANSKSDACIIAMNEHKIVIIEKVYKIN